MKYPPPSTHSPILDTQRGYTMTELLVAIALLALVTGVLSAALYQFYTVTSWGNAQLAVDADLRNAGLWLMRDGNESESFRPGGTCGAFYTGPTRNITYTYSYSASDQTLYRQDSSTGQIVGVARRITAAPICTTQARSVLVTLTPSSGGVSTSFTFTVTLRVD